MPKTRLNNAMAMVELARTKYANNMPIQKMVNVLDRHKMMFLATYQNGSQIDPLSGYAEGIKGSEGYDPRVYGIQMWGIEQALKQQTMLIQFSAVIELLQECLQDLGEDVNF